MMMKLHLLVTGLCFTIVAMSSVVAEVPTHPPDRHVRSSTLPPQAVSSLHAYGFTLLEPVTPFSPEPEVAEELDEYDKEKEETLLNGIVSSAESLIAHHSDYNSAVRRFRLASILGHSGAAATIGALLMAGDTHLKRDVAAGVASLRRAAQVGQPDALAMLGFLHASGLAERHGVRKGLDQALLYWTIAAETGNVYANSALGFRYMHAIGLRRDYETAARYYKQAARAIAFDGRYWPTPQNFQYGEIPLASSLMSVGRTRFKEGMFKEGPPEPTGDDHEVYHYHRHLAETGDTNSMTLLGSLLLTGGLGMRADHQQARERLRQAAAAGHGEAHGLMGHLALREGNYTAAMTHFRHSAAREDRNGHYALGMIFLHGLGGMKKDLSKAAMHFELAAERDHAKASFELGLMFDHGQGRDKNAEKAMKHFQASAKLGNIQSKFYLGVLLFDRRAAPGSEGNGREALRLFKEVAEAGEWNTLFDLAHSAFDRKDMFGSLYRHSQAAHAGIELGQHNAAMILEMSKEGDMAELSHWSRERMIAEMRELYEMSGLQGHTHSHIRAGDVSYLENNDFWGAFRSYNNSANMGNAEGMFSVGMMHARGEGVQMDREKAMDALFMVTKKDSGSVVAGNVAIVGLRLQWWLGDLWEWWTKVWDKTAPRQNEETSISGDESGTSEDGSGKLSASRAVKDRTTVGDDLALVGGLLAILVTVLLVRSKRLARQNGDSGRVGMVSHVVMGVH
ncbi:Sel1-repeat containing protein [Chondrus crispus]|uniref:Sel1-repeat containing protein n=1 Tax=Chondrus crispus TaxID=2769 RepID=R7QPQ7_CHOCR|nr:Sel1-repeat containing protein [Chondrus crispus]CDF40462.1 Sel1-repeat containing protein [Chondrus crispus]|eukprot:XP_005710756.1 Sel1-repeat containing protein [Chondrus crispus]